MAVQLGKTGFTVWGAHTDFSLAGEVREVVRWWGGDANSETLVRLLCVCGFWMKRLFGKGREKVFLEKVRREKVDGGDLRSPAFRAPFPFRDLLQPL